MLTTFALVFGTFGSLFVVSAPRAHADGTSCSVITLGSGATTQTAGYTETNPVSGVAALVPSNYSNEQFVAASTTQAMIPPWVDPSTNSVFASSSAVWVSTNPTWPGGTGNTEGSFAIDQWRLFQDSVVLPVGAVVTNATLWYTADNAAAVYLNSATTPIATTNASTSEDVYGVTPAADASNFGQVFTTSFVPTAGTNTLNFVVRNWSVASSSTQNPTGLLYAAVINYCVSPTAGTIGGTVTGGASSDGALAVTSVTATQTSASADGTFGNGWKYTFHITDPNNEPDLSLKFADWFNAVASSTIPAGGNIQISSAQASSTSPVVITAANVYSTPALTLVTDLDPATPGRQVDVVVEVKIPAGSINGAYTTSYGVQSLPH